MLLLVILKIQVYTQVIMARETIDAALAHHVREADRLFAVLGMDGEPRSFDTIDFIVAGQELTHFIEDEQQRAAIEKYLVNECRSMEREPDYTYGDIASHMLGLTVGAVVYANTSRLTFEQAAHLLDRSVQNLTIAKQTHGTGCVYLFHGGFQAAARDITKDAVRHQDRTLIHEQPVAPMVETSPRHTKLLPHIMRGLAGIAMMPGAMVQPPEHQTDEHGAWDPGLNLPDEEL